MLFRYPAAPCALAAALSVQGQTTTGLTWPGCPDLQATDFRKVELAIPHPASPTKMEIAPDGRLIFANTGGAIWAHDPKTKATATWERIPVIGGGTAWGLIGIALDPGFSSNGRYFVLYSAKPVGFPAAPVSYQLWRHTLAGGKADPAAAKLVLEYPADKGAFPVDHSGGGMAFDAQGNLYFSSGENSDWKLDFGNVDETHAEWNSLRTAGNTADLRGKVNRIRPGEDGSYSVPAGNLFAAGRDSTRPEIYAMGFRNPWTLRFDKATGTLLIADVGPQAEAADAAKGPAGMDEFHATREPANFGWPMFMGPNVPYNAYDYQAGKAGAFFDPAAPVNASRLNTGLRRLPPARPSIVAYGKDGKHNPWPGFQRGGAVPIAGPVYHYDGKNPSRIKLPPHFEGRWLVADAFQKWIKAIAMDAAATQAESVVDAFPGMAFPSTSAYSIIAMDIGPDGALYYAENGSNATVRVEYQGTCLPDVTPIALAPRREAAGPEAKAWLLHPGAARRADLAPGVAGVDVHDLAGRKVWAWRRAGADRPGTVELPSGLDGGILRVTPR